MGFGPQTAVRRRHGEGFGWRAVSRGGRLLHLAGVALDFAHRLDNIRHVGFAAEQFRLGNPDRLPRPFGGVGKGSSEEGIFGLLLRARKAAAKLTVLEHIQGVDGRVGSLGGDALAVEALDELLRVQAGEGVAVVVEDVGVVPVAGAARVDPLGGDAFNPAQVGVEPGSVARAHGSLGIQALELLGEDRPLPFRKAVVGAVVEVGVEPLAGETPAIVDGAGAAFKSGVAGDDDAALAGGHQFARLEGESTGGAE